MENQARAEKRVKDQLDALSSRIQELQITSKRKHEALQLKRSRRDYLQNIEARRLLKNRKNPYVVFRKRKLARIEKIRRRNLEERIVKRKASLLQMFNRYAAYARQKDEAEARQKAYATKYRASLGRQERESAVKRYLVRSTADSVDIIDPTGRAFRLFPSQVSKITSPR